MLLPKSSSSVNFCCWNSRSFRLFCFIYPSIESLSAYEISVCLLREPHSEMVMVSTRSRLVWNIPLLLFYLLNLTGSSVRIRVLTKCILPRWGGVLRVRGGAGLERSQEPGWRDLKLCAHQQNWKLRSFPRSCWVWLETSYFCWCWKSDPRCLNPPCRFFRTYSWGCCSCMRIVGKGMRGRIMLSGKVKCDF